MKKTILLITIWLMAMDTQAQTVSEQQARQTAAEFYQTHGANKSIGAYKALGSYKAKESPIQATLRKAYEAPHQALYVFNNPEETGFVIVAGNERANNPILGWSDNGPFDYDTAPCGLKALLEQYASGLGDSSFDGLGMSQKMDRNTPKHFTSENNEVAPLLTTQWNQEAPYYNQCPGTSDSHHYVTGCVITAMAQVMNYYQWPKLGRGKHTNESDGLLASYSQTRDFSQSVYDWENMIDNYETTEYTDVQANAVATLMADLGCAMDARYGTLLGTSAFVDDIVVNAAKYFRYKEEVLPRDEMAIYRTSPISPLTEHLEAGHPVLCSIQLEWGESHSVVCDGYRVEDDMYYYHINFGWGGQSDGYYSRETNSLFYGVGNGIAIVPSDGVVAEKDGVFCDIVDGEATVMCTTDADPGQNCRVVIPEEVEADGQTYPVTSINEYVFRKSHVTNLTIPGTIKRIPKYLCASTPISRLTLQEGVEEVGDNAFIWCRSLTSLDLPASIRRIGKFAFANGQLTGFTMHGSGYVLDDYAFGNNYQTLLWAGGLEGAAEIHTNAVIGKMESTFTVQPTCWYENNAVSGHFNSIVLPKELKSFNPLSVRGTAEYRVEAGNTAFSSAQGILYNHDRTTLLCVPEGSWGNYDTKRTGVVVPATVREIASCAFSDVVHFVGLPGSVEKMDSAFYLCRDLREVYCLTPTPPAIDAKTFKDKQILKVPYGSKSAYEQAPVWQDFAKIQDDDIIADGPFYYQFATSYGIGSASVIGRNTAVFFDGHAVIPETITVEGETYTCSSMDSYAGTAFTGDLALHTLTLPKTFSSVYGPGLAGCDNLYSVSAAEESKVKTIDGMVWHEKWGQNILDFCPPKQMVNGVVEERQSVIIPKVITRIGYGSFMPNLREVGIPASVTHIDDAAFGYCHDLSVIRCMGETPPFIDYSYHAFIVNGPYLTATLYVPKGCIDAYKQANDWRDFIDIREFDPADVTPVTISRQPAIRSYNLQGQRVDSGYRGIVVSGGRKVLSK